MKKKSTCCNRIFQPNQRTPMMTYISIILRIRSPPKHLRPVQGMLHPRYLPTLHCFVRPTQQHSGPLSYERPCQLTHVAYLRQHPGRLTQPIRLHQIQPSKRSLKHHIPHTPAVFHVRHQIQPRKRNPEHHIPRSREVCLLQHNIQPRWLQPHRHQIFQKQKPQLVRQRQRSQVISHPILQLGTPKSPQLSLLVLFLLQFQLPTPLKGLISH
mmetsp:Transcript_30325/g.43000  ORF Transcript_30325/g.43000 Transcript_30325/m.43000 type:complete len:212 (-) Transcript_30325:504-1139(-)